MPEQAQGTAPTIFVSFEESITKIRYDTENQTLSIFVNKGRKPTFIQSLVQKQRVVSLVQQTESQTGISFKQMDTEAPGVCEWIRDDSPEEQPADKLSE
jgi:hypothetical protein